MEATQGTMKKIKIKTGTLNRCVKDYKSYEKEVQQTTARLETLKKDCDDEGKVRQQEVVLAETVAMLPNCKSKIITAQDDLEAHVSQVDAEDHKENEDLKKAELALVEAKAFLETI